MSDGIYSALSGAVAQQQALDIVANNVANAGTVGYRGDVLAFREAVSREEGGPTPDGLRFVAVAQLSTDSRNGPLMQTGNRLDVALQGDGMLAIRTPEGVRYTRAGALRMDPQGVLRTASGHMVLDAGAAAGGNTRNAADTGIRIPRDAMQVQIGPDGTVTVDDLTIGQLRIDRFEEGDLEKQGLTLFVPKEGATGRPDTETQVLQGYLESANVSPVAGMNELISTSRAFEAFQRVIQAFRQIDERAAREVGAGR